VREAAVVGGDVVLEVENLRTEFRLRAGPVRAVDGISFTVQAGECVGLVGESGCGKSTTRLSIMKLLPRAFCVRFALPAWARHAARRSVPSYFVP
jgi:ABC-type glutathione transport system ATPase component